MTNAPRQYKTFSLTKPRDLLAKLKWDIEQLGKILSHTVEHHYQAINCAITAWQMCDWMYEELSEDERKLYPSEYKFREYIKQQSSWLRICRELADSSKHRQLKNAPSPNIGTPVVDVFVTKDNETIAEMYIYDGETIHMPVRVMLEAYDFWDDYLSRRGM